MDKAPTLVLRSLEGLRLVASLGIIVYHFVPYASGGLAAEDRLALFVDLFFVISGVVIAHAYTGRINSFGDYRDFLQKRVARLYPLHLATLVFYAAIAAAVTLGLLEVPNPAKYDWSEFIPNLLLIQAWGLHDMPAFNYVSWSISAEFFMYLTFPLIASAMARGAGWGVTMIVAITAAAAALASHFLNLPLWELTAQLGWLRALPSFAFGVWLVMNKEMLSPVVGTRRAQLGTAVFGTLLLLGMAGQLPPWAVIGVAWALAASAYLADIGYGRTLFSWQPLSAGGKLTYSLYMLHPVVATVFISFLVPRLLGTSPGTLWLGVVLAIPITFLSAIISFRTFEQPARRWLSPRTRVSACVTPRPPGAT